MKRYLRPGDKRKQFLVLEAETPEEEAFCLRLVDFFKQEKRLAEETKTPGGKDGYRFDLVTPIDNGESDDEDAESPSEEPEQKEQEAIEH